MRRALITHAEAASFLPLRVRRHPSLASAGNVSFFLSFADAFRGLMRSQNKKIDSILVPDFYCPETLDVYIKYGNLVYYHVRDDLTIDEENYLEAVRVHKPDMIVHYGFFGFPANNIEIRNLLASSPETLGIEDCEHKILLPEDVAFIHRNHIYLDSIRKQTSLLGSHVVAQSKIRSDGGWSRYRWQCAILRLKHETATIAAALFRSEYFYSKTEEYFERFNAVIGISEYATSGGVFAEVIWEHLDLKRMIQHKKDLIHRYVSTLSGLRNEFFHVPAISNENITYFPCLVSKKVQTKFISYLEDRGIWTGTLWELPDDSQYKINRRLLEEIIVLPLTWTMSVEDAGEICQAIKDFLIK